ncbi:MAG: hypothetical protein EOM14_13015 [Clostridia bacterium]|nr:hypothetical protein [Clostridia bacterium]
MNEQQKAGLQTEEWKELVSRLPGILNTEFILEGETIREIHVLADQSRFPKQIVRDIQSAMAARFQVELDHRIISVAQISSMPALPKKRILCQRLELSTGRDGITVAVTLELDGRQKKGESSAIHSSYDRSRCIAQAAVAAINAFLNVSYRFSVGEWKHVPMGEHDIVLVGLQLSIDGKSEYLVGACPEGNDPNLSVVLATLDAVNRRILTLSFSPDE